MEPDIPTKSKIVVLTSEMHTIHLANSLYWRQREAVTHEARAEYQRRQERLEEIRAELAHLPAA